VVIVPGGVISVGLGRSVKKYDKSGSTLLVEWKPPTEFKHCRVVACDEERLTVLSREGRLQVFELDSLKSSRVRKPDAVDSVLKQMRADQM
jgi:hypothetical protein